MNIKWINDPTRRFPKRPLYDIEEIEGECQSLVSSYFRKRGLEIKYPLATSVLSKILEQHTDRCDFGHDLSRYGDDVEALTQFTRSGKPKVFISSLLRDERYSNRRRMTMAHELGHVHFHAVLFQRTDSTLDLFPDTEQLGPTYCKRSTIARGGDWMEWQASYAGGAILMPADILAKQVNEIVAHHRWRLPLVHDFAGTHELVRIVADKFAVSPEAASVRLLQTGVIAPRQAQPLTF
jgi:Zn-dependent peptidase ImmA (M78 family)